ncbi:phospholipid phosphatase 1-like isoform X2 [Trichogramma pretiosum]|uniref:phospholipid phosphatase 1-like isoform X2 n=2 Tax=Trichogramma pretiosum TaxID=7493 RepID=UPI0006C987A7|nr:phospholipid phosphatase 1-like isoform X2 [Trichogramma pretiosum]
MVQMHTLSGAQITTSAVSYEVGGGIRNPACQDDDSYTTNTTPTKLDDHHHHHHHQRIRQEAAAVLHEAGGGGGGGGGGAGRLSASVAGNNNVKKLDEQQQQQQQQTTATTVPCKIHEKGRDEIKEIMTVCRSRFPWRFSANFVIAILVSILMLLGELGYIPNQQVGFWCNDPKIQFAFTGDSVSTVALILVTIVVPAVVIYATEWSCYSPESYKSLDCSLSTSSSSSNSQQSPSSRGRQFWQWYGYYTLGWWYLLFVVEIVKVVVGEPRPHFIDSCRPQGIDNCTNEYRRLYTCTNTELSWFYVNDSDKSFPSGHSALAIFQATFLIWYLQARIPERLVLILVKPWLQCLALLWGLGCSMSRITDNRHHWWDVLAGACLGLGFAVFVVRICCRSFRSSSGAGGAAGDGHGDESAQQQLHSAILLENGTRNHHHHHHRAMLTSGSNGYGSQAGSGPKRHQSVKKLLSDSSVETTAESREMGDVASTWTA